MAAAKTNVKSATQGKVITPGELKRMLITSAKLLEVNKSKIDSLNVFPVPDGDTGTNMSLTMASAIREISDVVNSSSMETLADKMAKGALRGARGNSGVILSQLLKGLANGIRSKNEVDAKTFAKGLKNGVEIAYSAVAKPKEGTMLTVSRVMAETAMEISKKNIEIGDFLDKLVIAGEEILARTPDMLDVLKKAGVVDSGGYGVVTIFRGLAMGYRGEEVTGAEDYDAKQTPVKTEDDVSGIDYSSLDDITFGYCTEFFVTNIYPKTTLTDIDKLREKLNAIGDSTLVIGDLTLIKVHVHTNQPGVALTYALELGEVDKIKIENMLQQNRELKAKYEREKKPIGLLAICAGKGFNDIFKDLGVDQVIEGGQSMNPSADDIAQAIRKINAENVIILPNNKNIILAAEQSRTLINNKQIFVIPTKNMPQGLASVLAFNPDASLHENLESMTASLSGVKAGSVTYAVRSSKIDGVEFREGEIIGLDASRILTCGDKPESVATDLIDRMKESDHEILTLYYGKDVKEEDAQKLCDELQEKYDDCEVDLHYGGQPLYYYIFSLE